MKAEFFYFCPEKDASELIRFWHPIFVSIYVKKIVTWKVQYHYRKIYWGYLLKKNGPVIEINNIKGIPRLIYILE